MGRNTPTTSAPIYVASRSFSSPSPVIPQTQTSSKSLDIDLGHHEKRRQFPGFSLGRIWRKLSHHPSTIKKTKSPPGPSDLCHDLKIITDLSNAVNELNIKRFESEPIPSHLRGWVQADDEDINGDRPASHSHGLARLRSHSLNEVDRFYQSNYYASSQLPDPVVSMSNFDIDDNEDIESLTPRPRHAVITPLFSNIDNIWNPDSPSGPNQEDVGIAPILLPPRSPSPPFDPSSLYRCDTLTSYNSTIDLSTRPTSVAPSNLQNQDLDKSSFKYFESEGSRRSSISYLWNTNFDSNRPQTLAKESKWRIVKANLNRMKQLEIPPLPEEINHQTKNHDTESRIDYKPDNEVEELTSGCESNERHLMISDREEDIKEITSLDRTAKYEIYATVDHEDIQEHMSFSFFVADQQSMGSRRSSIPSLTTNTTTDSFDYVSSELPSFEAVSQVVVLRLKVLLRNYTDGQVESSKRKPTNGQYLLDATANSAMAASSTGFGNDGGNGGNGNDSDPEDETSGKRPALKIKTSQNRFSFACPFYKNTPSLFEDSSVCASRGWNSIPRLKEHLYRKHKRPRHCTRCLIGFQSHLELEIHTISGPSCEVRLATDASKPVGIDLDQEEQLRNRNCSPNRNTEGSWIKIYQILFPEVAILNIPNPYFDDPTTIPRHEPSTLFVNLCSIPLSSNIEIQQESLKPIYDIPIDEESDDYHFGNQIHIRSSVPSPIHFDNFSRREEFQSSVSRKPGRDFDQGEDKDDEAILSLYLECLCSAMFHEIYSHVKQYSPYRKHGSGSQPGGESFSYHAPTDNEGASRPSGPGNSRSKRPLKDTQEDGSDDEGPPDNSKRIKCIGRKLITMRKFSCPYFKRFPDHPKHTNCSAYGFSSAARVKEHIYRHHRAIIRCGRCLEPFPSRNAVTDHHRGVIQCELRLDERDESEGINEDVERSLKSRKGMRGKSEERRWKDIFQILFKSVDENDIPDPFIEVQADKMEQFKPYLIENLPSRLEHLMAQRLQRTLSYQRSNERLSESSHVPMTEQLRNINTEILAELPSMLHGIFSEFEMGHQEAIPSIVPTITNQDIGPSMMPHMSIGSSYGTTEPSRIFSGSVFSQDGTSTSIDPQSSRFNSVSSAAQAGPQSFPLFQNWMGTGVKSHLESYPLAQGHQIKTMDFTGSMSHPDNSGIASANQPMGFPMLASDAKAEDLLDFEQYLSHDWDHVNEGSAIPSPFMPLADQGPISEPFAPANLDNEPQDFTPNEVESGETGVK